MKRNSIYLVFVFGGAILGERVRARAPSPSISAAAVLEQQGACHVDPLLCLHSYSNRLLGAQVVNGLFNKAWEENNKGVRHCS